MATMPPATSFEIAERADLNERYVRECLGALTTARIVEYDVSARTYHLPPAHAALLTRAAAPNNIASTMASLPMLGSVEDRILECFRRGGGVPYEAYPRFHEWMAEDSDQSVVSGLLDDVVPLVEGLDERLAEGIDVLDVGCGSGHAVVTLARNYPKSRFVGYDLCAEAIDAARVAAREAGVRNVVFETRDVEWLPEDARYDLVTAFDAIHDQARPAEVLAAVRGVLREDGVFLVQDIRASSHLENNLDHPLATFLYTISCMHCMSVSLARGGAGLGTVWGAEKAVEMLGAAGFSDVVTRTIEHDAMNNWYVARP
jgi:2-polyprenyl-3-methyl-5-hydroxy-6-metoxy-1,4-benzoquinol methylase